MYTVLKFDGQNCISIHLIPSVTFSLFTFFSFEIYLLVYHPLVHWVPFHSEHGCINLLVWNETVGCGGRRERRTDSIWEQP